MAAAIAAVAEPSEEEQLALLPPSRFAADGFEPDAARARRSIDAVRRDRAGRPPGARNLATRQMLDFVRRVVGDPVLERARWTMLTPESLAAELGCTKLEAFDRIDRIRSELARLWYAPLAPVDGQGNAVVPSFNMLIGGAPTHQDGSARPWDYLDLKPAETQQNQGFSEGAPNVSHGDVSHDEAK